MLAHIRNGKIIKRFSGKRGWFTCEDGAKCSPPTAGFVRGNDRIVPIEEVTEDTSTTDQKIATTQTTVEADRVIVTRTIRDKTAQELSDEQDVLIASAADQLLGKVIFQIANDVRELKGQKRITAQQFHTYLKGLI